MRSSTRSILPIGGVTAGDVVTHPTFGRGVSLGGWAGHLKVDFPSGRQTFTTADDLMMVAAARAGEWNLVPSAYAEASRVEQDRLRQIALTQVRETLTKDFLRSDAVYEAGPAEYLSRAEYEQEKVAFVQAWVARASPPLEARHNWCLTMNRPWLSQRSMATFNWSPELAAARPRLSRIARPSCSGTVL